MKIGIPWHTRIILWFIRPQYSVDLNYWVMFKRFKGKVYIIREGLIK